MLIEAQYKVGDVVSIKLSSGEEMIARFEDENEDVVTVAKPYILISGTSSQRRSDQLLSPNSAS